MVYRKGELSPAVVDRGWPHQVAIRSAEAAPLGYIPSSGPHSSLCPRGHTVFDGVEEYRIYAFADREQAARFCEFLGGEAFDPRERSGRRWLRGRAAKLDAKAGNWSR